MSSDSIEPIRNLLHLYGIAVDGRRWDLFDRIFAPTVRAEYGEGKSVFDGLEAFKAGAAAAWGRFDFSQHSMANTVFSVDGTRAFTLTYGSWHIVRKGTEGGDLWEGRGWYDDVLEKDGGAWKIIRRICRVGWGRGNPMVMQPEGSPPATVSTTSLHQEITAGRSSFLNHIDQLGGSLSAGNRS